MGVPPLLKAARFIWIPAAVLAAPLQAQVGLASGGAQVALLAHVPARGSVHGVGPERESGRLGAIREVAVTVRLSANTGYQLLVRGTALPSTRVWVRTVDGSFQELTAGGSLVVARERLGAGEWERAVHYRIEMPENGETAGPLPVRYELAINPAM